MAAVVDSLVASVVVASVVVSVGAAVLVTVVVDAEDVVAAVVSVVAVVVVAICFLQAAKENRARMMQTQMAMEIYLRFILTSPMIMAADGIFII